ncbi:hypothetical protein PIB30_009735 [Stylosanthes scabra]|uniref:Uncharacterized protein n=1 Tax=Stylosanthes scabra TaxID=79078 RepID=A0ABU6W3A6_9FABA|nr:hypothetical protein [Stylosanthes scabra]
MVGVHVLRFRSRAWEHILILVERGDRATSYPCWARQTGSILSCRVVPVFLPSRRAWTLFGPYYRLNIIHVSMWAVPCYRSVVSDLSSQVGPPDGMWAEWVRSAFCVVWSNGPSKIGPRWASSLGSEVGYEHCSYAELWPLTGALRVIEYPQNERDPCRRETRFRVRRCPFVHGGYSLSFSLLLQYLTPLSIIITNLSSSLFPSLLPSPSMLRRGAVALSRELGSSSSCVADVDSDLSFFLFISCFTFLFQLLVVIRPFSLLETQRLRGGRGRDSGFGTGRTFPEFNRIFVLCLFIVMARGDISVMPANVPEDMDWVEDVVLLSKSVVDEELLASFREAHAVYVTVSEESRYELVAPSSEERVCYYNIGHPEERHFIYMYECLFSKLGVRVPFTQFEQDVLYECHVAPT